MTRCNPFSLLFLSILAITSFGRVQGAALPEERDLWDLARENNGIHVFSTLFTAQDVRSRLSSSEGIQQAIAWCKQTGVTKVYIEEFRDAYQADRAAIVSARDAFLKAGFAVSGCITPTKVGKASTGWKESISCYTDAPTQDKVQSIFEYAASLFDEIMIDDFWFTDCACPDCESARQKKEVRIGANTYPVNGSSWEDYRCELMVRLSRDRVLAAAKRVNPNARLIIKFPQWYDNFHERGYEVLRQTADFDLTWVGTESRDYNDPRWGGKTQYESFFIMRWLGGIGGSKCGGGWFDWLGTTPRTYVEQARQTVLGGARESMLFCYGGLQGSTGPGDVEALRAHIPELFRVARQMHERDLTGMAAYKPANSHPEEEKWVFDFVGMLGLPLVPCHAFPSNAPAAFFSIHALKDNDFATKLDRFIADGKPVLLTDGLVRRLQDRPSLKSSNVHILPVQGEPKSLLQLPQGTLDALRAPLLRPLNVSFQAPNSVALYLFKDGSYVVENFNDTDALVRLDGKLIKVAARGWDYQWSSAAEKGQAGMATPSSSPPALFQDNLENGLGRWKEVWSRTAHAATVTLDSLTAHSQIHSARIDHRGTEDWSFEPKESLSVQEGDFFEMEAWLKLEGQGTVTLCATTRDKAGKVLSWSFGERTRTAQPGWFRLHTRFAIPGGVTQIQPRLIGYRPAIIWVDDFSVTKPFNIAARQAKETKPALTLRNDKLEATIAAKDGSISVLDRRSGLTSQQKLLIPDVTVLEARAQADAVSLRLFHLSSGLELTANVSLVADGPELTVELTADGEMPAALQYPSPFVSKPGQYLVIPMNEGISYPVDDASIEPMRLIAYGGHGICMGFWGATDGTAGHMAILETPDDASIRVDRVDGKLTVAPEWEPQKGAFGYSRRLRYVFFEQGGHVAMCKRYRAYAQEKGFFKTLSQKRAQNPNVDRLIGAVNVWCWDQDAVSIVREMQAAGIERILWSNGQPPEKVRTLNDLGVLTSRYDIYQDVMDPAQFPSLRWKHPDWPSEAWPKDIMLSADGDWIKGWGVEGKDDRMHPCGVLCDKVAPEYARRRIPEDLATHPYRCRFIDTTTASPWRECYSTNHPLTRTESRQTKMELLKVVSDDLNLVTGCETGHDASVPYVHYFEGMLSLGPYRVPDAGRDMQRIWTEVPEAVAKFQLGHRYRLPLWELTFHDCVAAQWYWGDYNNKLPALWVKRDLFNLLYGTTPMFMFNRSLWNKEKDRFVRSYRTSCPTAREVGYSEMLDHQFLTPERDVQQTAFQDGTTITVNFSSNREYRTDEFVLPPLSSRVKKAGK